MWYKSGRFPEYLYTCSQLRKLKLKPAPNQKPAGYWHRQCYHADIDLWDAREAIPMRQCSPAQLEALAKARAKIGERERIEERLRLKGTVITEEYKDCLIVVTSWRTHWTVHVELKDQTIWRWSLFEEWHQVCLKVARKLVDISQTIEGNLVQIEGSCFFRALNEENRKRREALKKLENHCSNCGEPIATLMLDCPHCEMSYS